MRYFIYILVCLAVASCAKENGADSAGDNHLPNPVQESPEHSDRNRPEYVVTTQQEDDWLRAEVFAFQGDAPAKIGMVSVPLPPDVAEQPEFGKRYKVISSVSGDKLLVCASLTGESTQTEAHIRIVGLNDPGDVMHSEVLDGQYVTAAHSSLGGWLLGSVNNSADSGSSLRIQHAVFHDQQLVVGDVWSSRTSFQSYPLHSKEIDAFARSGKKIVAIDDVFRPKYAIELKELESKHEVVSVYSLESGANERYFEGALEDDRLIALSSYDTGGASGQRMRSFRIGADGLKLTRELDEHIPRVYGDEGYRLLPEKAELLHGEKLTRWRDVVVWNDRAWIAAGERGVLRADLDLSNLLWTETEGECRDLILFQDRLLTLILRDESAVLADVLISDGKPTLKQLHQVATADCFAD